MQGKVVRVSAKYQMDRVEDGAKYRFVETRQPGIPSLSITGAPQTACG
jgi:hypothetical protein